MQITTGNMSRPVAADAAANSGGAGEQLASPTPTRILPVVFQSGWIANGRRRPRRFSVCLNITLILIIISKQKTVLISTRGCAKQMRRNDCDGVRTKVQFHAAADTLLCDKTLTLRCLNVELCTKKEFF